MFESFLCPYCDRWNDEIAPAYPKTIEGCIAPLKRVDHHLGPRSHPRGIAPVIHTPTFLLMDGDEEVGRITGYPGEDFFWPMLAEIIASLPDHDARERICRDRR